MDRSQGAGSSYSQGAGGFEALLQGPTTSAGPQRLKGLPLRKRTLPDERQETKAQGANRQQSLPEEAANGQPEESAVSSPNEEPAASETAAPRSNPNQPEAGGRTGRPSAGTSATDVSPALKAYGSQNQLDHDSAIGSGPDESNGNPSLQPHVPDRQSAVRPLETSSQRPPFAADDLHHRGVYSKVEQPVEHLDGQQDSAGRDGPPTAGSPTVLVEPSPRSARAFWAQRETGEAAFNLPRPRTPVSSAAAEQRQGNGPAVPQPNLHASEAPNAGLDPAAKSKAVAAAEAAICDRFGNPVLSTGVANGPGRALAAAEDFRDGVPAFAFFREAAAKAQEEARRAGARPAAGASQAAPQASHEAQAGPSEEALELPVSTPPVLDRVFSADSVPEAASSDLPSASSPPSAPVQPAQEDASSASKQTESGRLTNSEQAAAAESLTASLQPSESRQEEPEAFSEQDSSPPDTFSTSHGALLSQAADDGIHAEEQPLEQSAQRSDAEPATAVATSQSVGEAEESVASVASGQPGNAAAAERDEVVLRAGLAENSPQPEGEDPAQSLLADTTQAAGEELAEPPESATAAPEAPFLEEYDGRASVDLGRLSAAVAAAGTAVDAASASTSVGLPGDEDSASAMAASDLGSVGDSEHLDSEHGGKQEPRQLEARGTTAAATDLASVLRAAPPGETSGRGSDQDPDWRAQTKHVFVLSNAGKPVFTLHGDENQLAGFMAVIHAMLSFAADRGDALHDLRAGRHRVVFIVRGSLYLVAVSSRGEPAAVLCRQLAVLYSQILCILTNGFERMFARNPRFDSRRLLGGTDAVLRGLVAGFDRSPWTLLKAFPPLPLAPHLRHACLTSLQSAAKASGALYGVLLVGDLVCAVAQTRAHPLDQGDLLLLCNFVLASDSFLQSPESFTPVCLPAFNPGAFLHAYVHYLHKEARICLVLLSTQQDAFYTLAAAGQKLRRELRSVLQEVAAVALKSDGGGRVRLTDLPPGAGGRPPGETPLLQFVYKSPARGQFAMPAWTCPLDNAGFRQEVISAYARVHAAMFPEQEAGSTQAAAQRIHFEQTDICTILAFAGTEFELYAAFDALVEKPQALEICQKLSAWVKANQATLFMPV